MMLLISVSNHNTILAQVLIVGVVMLDCRMMMIKTSMTTPTANTEVIVVL